MITTTTTCLNITRQKKNLYFFIPSQVYVDAMGQSQILQVNNATYHKINMNAYK
jgi:hypothetical protein